MKENEIKMKENIEKLLVLAYDMYAALDKVLQYDEKGGYICVPLFHRLKEIEKEIEKGV